MKMTGINSIDDILHASKFCRKYAAKAKGLPALFCHFKLYLTGLSFVDLILLSKKQI